MDSSLEHLPHLHNTILHESNEHKYLENNTVSKIDQSYSLTEDENQDDFTHALFMFDSSEFDTLEEAGNFGNDEYHDHNTHQSQRNQFNNNHNHKYHSLYKPSDFIDIVKPHNNYIIDADKSLAGSQEEESMSLNSGESGTDSDLDCESSPEDHQHALFMQELTSSSSPVNHSYLTMSYNSDLHTNMKNNNKNNVMSFGFRHRHPAGRMETTFYEHS